MDDFEGLFGAEPLLTFYIALSGDERVKLAVREQFGSAGEAVLDGMRTGGLPPDHSDALHDLLVDLLSTEGSPAQSFVGRGDFDDFPITVMQFGPVFWIEAQEFDDIGYFSDCETAASIAESNYEPFISNAADAFDDE